MFWIGLKGLLVLCTNIYGVFIKTIYGVVMNKIDIIVNLFLSLYTDYATKQLFIYYTNCNTRVNILIRRVNITPLKLL